jgi:guanylate kinase
MSCEGLLVVLTAPSGAGKTTLARRVFELEPRLRFSVSHTTRAPREGECQGVDYHFVSDPVFDALEAEGAFAEWAHVHERRYGTSRAEIARLRKAGADILLDIDYQGAEQLLRAYPEAVGVFLTPPSLQELERRLVGRGTESQEQVALRLASARRELLAAPKFQYLIVNQVVEEAVADFRAILRAERLRTSRREADLRRFGEG